MDWLHYQANQLFFQILDADTYRKPLDARSIGNSAGFRIGNGTLFVPARLYFAVYCDTLNTESIEYKLNYRNIQPITTGKVTTGSITSGKITTGSVTTGEVTTGAAFTTGDIITSGDVTTHQMTSGDITTGAQKPSVLIYL